MKKILGLFAVLFLVVFGVIITRRSFNNGFFPFNVANIRPATVTIDKHSFTVTVAKTELEKETGLSGKASLPQDQGMLFLFDNPDIYGFWMKNMKFPIDIIYLNNNKIVTIINSAPNPKNNTQQLTIYKPTQPADKVLEINTGLSKKYGFKDGDSVAISL